MENFFFSEPESDVNYKLEQIMHDSSISFPILEQLWKQTTKYRLNEIANCTGTSEILKKWHHYTQPLGYRLVSIIVKLVFF
jgi:hypothetical protein